jgi:hypothetical protein
MARPTYKFDQKDARFVATLTKYGVAVADIARELDVDPKTLQRHFGEIIATAVAYGGQLKTMPCGNVRKQEALERRSRCGIEWYAQT